jgi:hypothetical protein
LEKSKVQSATDRKTKPIVGNSWRDSGLIQYT